MPIYHIAEEPKSPRKKVRDAFVFAAVWLVGFSVVTRLADGRWYPLVALAVGGALFFVGILLTETKRKAQTLDIEIDDAGIRSLWNGEEVRNVRSGRVGYVGERRGIYGRKLVVSERGGFRARFFGRVTVFKRLVGDEAFERIKAQAYRWLENSKQ